MTIQLDSMPTTTDDDSMVAALSILSIGPTRSIASVVGDIGGHNAEWLAMQLGHLEGDVTLDCRHSRFLDHHARSVLEQFGRRLAARGNRLAITGLSIA